MYFLGCLCDTRWKHLEGCHCLKGAYWGNAYWRKEWWSWHTHARTDWRTRSFPSFPTEGTLTEAALPVTVAAIILQALSTDCLLQVSTLLTTSLSTHTYWVCTLTHRRAHCTPTSTHTVHIHTHTHTHIWLYVRLCFSSTIRSAQANGSNESKWCVGADILLKPGETHNIVWMWVLM